MNRTFLRDIIDFSSLTVHSLHKDSFTECFLPISPLEMDTSKLYIFSIFIRYLILFPVRLVILFVSTLIFIPVYSFCLFFKYNTEMIFRLYCSAFLTCFGARIHHHGIKKRETVPHVYIANHTSFVDYIILSSYKFCHACVSENHGGLFGFLFRNILNSNGSISFKRSEKQDRNVVKHRLSEHINNVALSPMLVFPEGTCVNNKYTVLFQKGIFELDVLFKPVSIKFRRNTMDPYWNRRKHNFTIHLLYLMTRWRLEADVWWMEGVYKEKNIQNIKKHSRISVKVTSKQNVTEPENMGSSDNGDLKTCDKSSQSDKEEDSYESANDLAHRIKTIISERGGLKSVYWNGYFKSQPVLRDREILREAYKQFYVQREAYKIEPNNEQEIDKYTVKSDNERAMHNMSENTKQSPSKSNDKPKKYEKNILRNRNVKNYNNQKGARFVNAVDKTNTKKCNMLYFERFTYESLIENVLQEYLNMKTGKLEFVATEDIWWGYNRGKQVCKCNKEKKMYCHEGGCRSEYFMQKHN